MTGPPAGWSSTTLGDLAETIRNGIFASRPTDDPNGVKILRISAVRNGRVGLDDCKYVSGLVHAQIAKFCLSPGDLLFTRYNGSRRLVGICGLVPEHAGPILHPDKLIRVVVPDDRVDGRFLNYQMESHSVRRYLEPRIRTTAGQSGIAGADIRGIPVLMPELAEQRRIVDILEDHLSRLDAATALAMSAVRRLDILQMSGLWRNTHDLPGSEGFTLSDVAEVRLGRQRSPKNHMGNRMRSYLRAANVGWDELRLDDVKQMQFTELESAIYELHDGDILLTEASGSSSEVGKSAIYRGEVTGVCFQNTLLRVRCHEGVNPKFVQMYLLAEARLGKFVAESRGVGIIHLGRARLASWPILLPSGEGQDAAVNIARELAEATVRARECTQTAMIRAQGLRRALLTAAFSGRLTGRAVDVEMAEEMAGV
jgi:type I restriction enzyme S subunit